MKITAYNQHDVGSSHEPWSCFIAYQSTRDGPTSLCNQASETSFQLCHPERSEGPLLSRQPDRPRKEFPPQAWFKFHPQKFSSTNTAPPIPEYSPPLSSPRPAAAPLPAPQTRPPHRSIPPARLPAPPAASPFQTHHRPVPQ